MAAVWPRPGTVRGLGQLAAGDVSVAFGANGRGDVVGWGTYHSHAQRVHVLFTSVDRRRPRTLLPLSGDLRSESGAHYVSENRPTAVGGSSEMGNGTIHATLWTCAERQAFEPPRPVGDSGGPTPHRPYLGGHVLRR